MELIRNIDQSESLNFMIHDTQIFPEDTDETVTLTAGGAGNAWTAAWTRIADNNAINMDSKFTGIQTHIASVVLESVDQTGELYIAEFGYGPDADNITTIARIRAVGGAQAKLPPKSQDRIRTLHIPSDSKFWYRSKCAVGGGAMTIHFRFYCHS